MSAQQESNWPSWKIALAVGVPIAVGGVGYYLYQKSNRPIKDPTNDEPLTARKDPDGRPATERFQSEPQDPFTAATKKKNEGNAAFKKAKYAEAIEKYTEAISLCPVDFKQELSTFHQNKAAAYEKLGNNEGVIEECSKAIEYNPKYVKALFRRSRALEIMGRKSECLEDMTAVCIMEQFQNATSMVFADRVLKEMGKEMAAERYKNRGPIMPSVLFVNQYFASFTEDIVSLPLTDEEREFTESGYICSRLALERGDLERVIPECTREIEAATSSEQCQTQETDTVASPVSDEPPKYLAAAYLLRGSLHLLQGKSASSRPDLDKVIEMDIADVKLLVNALIKRGSLHMQEQRADEAQADFDYAVKLDPQNTDVLHHRGQLYILLDKTNDALKDFKECMRIKPDFALAHAQYCYSVYRQAFSRRDAIETRRAMAKFEELIKETPNCSESFGLYAQALTDQGDLDKADEMFQNAIRVEPDNATQYVHRGLLCLQAKQDIEESVRLVRKAIEIDAKCDFAHETMGTIEVQRGNLVKATEHFEIAINLAKSEMEMAHLFSLKVAAIAQANLVKKYGITTPSFGPGS